MRIKRELETDLNPDTFSHFSFYNQVKGRIEMHLKSSKNQLITIEGETIAFEKGETVHTENSYKYSMKEIEELSRKGEFILKEALSDKDKLFSVCILEASN